MRHGPLQYVFSALFIVQMYLVMAVMAIAYVPVALLRRDGAQIAVHHYTSWVLWTARWMLGLRTEIRGTVPTDEVLICSKHQSFLDIIMIVNATPAPKFIMKAILRYAPFLGWYAMRIGCVPVDRGRRAEAIRQMVAGGTDGTSPPGQLIIFPQGTRVAPGVHVPYKVGAAVLYRELEQPCVPAATNVGVFWPRRGLLRKPGLAVLEFLDPIEPGLDRAHFMKRLETVVETRSDALMREGGFNPYGISHDDRGA